MEILKKFSDSVLLKIIVSTQSITNEWTETQMLDDRLKGKKEILNRHITWLITSEIIINLIMKPKRMT